MSTLSIDDILDQATPAERDVPLCLNGKLRAEYEAVKARIAVRVRAKVESDAAAVLSGDQDDTRLGTPDPEQDSGDLDPEQGLLDDLIQSMKAHTVVFKLAAMPEQDYTRLCERHPPRTTDEGTRHPSDWEGVDASSFYEPLVRGSLAEPKLTDGQWERVRGVLSSAQWEKLTEAAKIVNRREEDLPFSLSDLVAPPS